MSLAANVPLIVMCHPSVPAKDLKEFVAFTKEQNKADKGVFYGTTGPGSVMHLSAETLEARYRHQDGPCAVPRRRAAGAGTALRPHPARRRSDLHLARRMCAAARLRGLATLSPARATAMPEVMPTVREQGFPNMELFGWNGFFAPAKTPPAVVAAIQAEMAKAARDPDVRRRLAEVGAEVMGSTQEELAKVLRDAGRGRAAAGGGIEAGGAVTE